MQDRFVKVMLVIVAALLAVNLFRTQDAQVNLQLPSLIGSAQAQSTRITTATDTTPTTYQVRSIEGFPVENLKDVVSLGDGKSFVVSNTKGFMVYQVFSPTR